MPLSPSELVLNADGSVYHLALHPDRIADTVITVGDPGRVPRVSRHFDSIEYEGGKREFLTHTGRLGRRRLTVTSTGIGTDNVDIVLTELDILANVDLQRREIREEHRALNILRLGTSGALQDDLAVDSLVVSTHGLGLDGLLGWYGGPPDSDPALRDALLQHLGELPVRPYLAAASPDVERLFPPSFARGVTATCPGFYGPQGRRIRLPPAVPDLLDRLASFRHGPHRVTNLEMETAGIFGLAGLLGHRACSVNTILANRPLGGFSPDPAAAVDGLIASVLEVLAAY